MILYMYRFRPLGDMNDEFVAIPLNNGDLGIYLAHPGPHLGKCKYCPGYPGKYEYHPGWLEWYVI